MENQPYCLHICRWYPDHQQPDLGNFVKHHVHAASQVVPAVVIYVRKSSSPFLSKQQNQSVQTYLKGFKDSGNPIFNAIKRYWHTRRLIQKAVKIHGKPSMIHAHLHTRPVIWAERLSRKFKIPFFITEHWSGYCNGEFHKISWLKRYYIKKLFPKSLAILPVSEFLEKGMQDCGIDGNYKVIPNLVYPLGLTRRASLQNFRFMFIGDFRDEIKNITGILKAFADVKEPADLHLIGDGQDAELIREKVKELNLEQQVNFEGLLPHPTTIEKLAFADCLILNSRIETFSVIAAEAVSMGIPVISTRCGGPEEFLSNETGFLVPIDDHDALVNAMKDMLKADHGLPRVTAIDEVKKKFSLEQLKQAFKEVYSL